MNIQTTGAGKDSHITIAGSDVAGLGGTHLKVTAKSVLKRQMKTILNAVKTNRRDLMGVAIQFAMEYRQG